MSYGRRSDLFDQAIRTGDIVVVGRAPQSRFSVVAIYGDNVWLRDVVTGADHLARLTRCRRVNGAA